MMNICPCCKRKMPEPRGVDSGRKKLLADMKKAMASLETCQRIANHETDEWHTEALKVACVLHIAYLKAAMVDPAKLWRIYRRNDKDGGYGIAEAIAGEAAA